MLRSFALPLGFALLLIGCNYHERKSLETEAGNLRVVDAVLDGQARAILTDRCSHCHGGTSAGWGNFGSSDDPLLMIQEGWIRLGQPELSPLIRTLKAGYMPPKAPLSSEELGILEAWVSRAMEFGEVFVLPPPVFATGTSALTRQVVGILDHHCSPCHNPVTGERTGHGILDMRDPAAMVQDGRLVPGHSESSPAFQTILQAQAGKAPFEALPEDEVELIRNWIDTDLTADVPPLLNSVGSPH